VPHSFTLTPEQFEEFDRRGVLRFEGLLSAGRVRAALEYVQSRLERLGLWQGGEWRLADTPKPVWPDRRLKTSEVVGNKHPAVEALLEEPALLAAIDALLGGRPFDRTMHKRPQVLFTLPTAGGWMLPDGWHADSARLASGQSEGVQLFGFLDTVEPRGGGTVVIAGSHRLFNFGRHIHGKEFTRLVREEPFLRGLLSPGVLANVAAGDPLPKGVSGAVELEVLELTGEPGDAYLIDLRILHAGAPNASERPRMMVTHRFVRADLLPEIAEAYGWPTSASLRSGPQ
jgi:hypothetical protein